MSKYEWERGTIKIPAKEWSSFRTALIKAHNALELAKLEKAVRLHAEATESLKGKRGSKRQEALRAFEQRHDRDYEVLCLVIGHEYDRETRKGTMVLKPAPKKKDIKVLPTTKDCTLQADDGTITLRNETKSVTWSVGENNHACEHARNHPMGRKLFELLRRITWTRGSGGKILGNDEYNRESGEDYEGGGGSYVTAEFSLEQSKRAAKAKSHYSTNYPSHYRGW
jgi:hypothetical protein